MNQALGYQLFGWYLYGSYETFATNDETTKHGYWLDHICETGSAYEMLNNVYHWKQNEPNDLSVNMIMTLMLPQHDIYKTYANCSDCLL